MRTADEYRRRAAELKVHAAQETDWDMKCQFEALALSYLRLAEHADRNSVPKDIYYETPDRSVEGT